MMKNTLCAFIAALLLIPVVAQAQYGARLDSLMVLRQQMKPGGNDQIKLTVDIATDLSGVNPKEGLRLAEEALDLAQKTGQPLLVATATETKGMNQVNLGLLDQAEVSFKNASDLFGQLGIPAKVAKNNMRIGIIYAMQSDFKTALEYFTASLNQFESLHDQANIASCASNMASLYTKTGEQAKALLYFQKALEIYEATGDEKGIATITGNTGSLYLSVGKYPEAVQYFLKALQLREKRGDKKGVSTVLNNLSVVYSYLSEPQKALEYTRRSLEIDEEIGNTRNIASGYVNLGVRYKDLNNPAKSLEAYQKALEYLRNGKDPETLGNCLINIGVHLQSQKDYSGALEYYRKAFETYKNAGHPNTTFIEDNIAQLYRYTPDSVLQNAGIEPGQKLQKSEEMLLNSLETAKSGNMWPQLNKTWEGLAQTYEMMGDYRKAYDAFLQHIIYRDSINGEEAKKQAARKEIQFEFDKKETVLKFEQQLTLEQLTQQKLLSIQQEQALNIKQQALTISDKEKDLQRLAYLKEKAEKQEKEQLLSLSEKDKQIQEVQLGSLIQDKALQLQTLAKQNALIGFLLAGLAAILLGFAAFSFWQRQKRAKKEAVAQVQYTQQLLENTEEERGRIARDLHDGVSHELLTLKKALHNTEAGQKIDGIIDDIRQISRNLHPVMLESIGLKLSLETLCDQYMEQGELFISHNINYTKRLPGTAELQLFRIVQEAITNTIKYAGADACKVTLQEQNNALRLTIQDNGRGFDVDQALHSGKSFGLRSILQRSKAIGGQANIRSSQEGTVVEVSV